MKRKLIATVLMCCALCVPSFAHPGRTDAMGGHTESATGEYHYHHGYSEHQHYDMNGDGIKDCPYEFKDDTEITSKEITPKQKGTRGISDLTIATYALIAAGVLYLFCRKK